MLTSVTFVTQALLKTPNPPVHTTNAHNHRPQMPPKWSRVYRLSTTLKAFVHSIDSHLSNIVCARIEVQLLSLSSPHVLVCGSIQFASEMRTASICWKSVDCLSSFGTVQVVTVFILDYDQLIAYNLLLLTFGWGTWISIRTSQRDFLLTRKWAHLYTNLKCLEKEQIKIMCWHCEMGRRDLEFASLTDRDRCESRDWTGKRMVVVGGGGAQCGICHVKKEGWPYSILVCIVNVKVNNSASLIQAWSLPMYAWWRWFIGEQLCENNMYVARSENRCKEHTYLIWKWTCNYYNVS